MAKFKCINSECERFDNPIEASIDENTGEYTMDSNIIETCPICKGKRIYDEEANKPSEAFNIDHTNLNSKRLFSNKSKGTIY